MPYNGVSVTLCHGRPERYVLPASVPSVRKRVSLYLIGVGESPLG